MCKSFSGVVVLKVWSMDFVVLKTSEVCEVKIVFIIIFYVVVIIIIFFTILILALVSVLESSKAHSKDSAE